MQGDQGSLGISLQLIRNVEIGLIVGYKRAAPLEGTGGAGASGHQTVPGDQCLWLHIQQLLPAQRGLRVSCLCLRRDLPRRVQENRPLP